MRVWVCSLQLAGKKAAVPAGVPLIVVTTLCGSFTVCACLGSHTVCMTRSHLQALRHDADCHDGAAPSHIVMLRLVNGLLSMHRAIEKPTLSACQPCQIQQT